MVLTMAELIAQNAPNYKKIKDSQLEHLIKSVREELLQILNEMDIIIKDSYQMTKLRKNALMIISFVVLLSVFTASSSQEAIIMLIGGVAGIIGIAPWGYSSKEVSKIVKSYI